MHTSLLEREREYEINVKQTNLSTMQTILGLF